MPDPGEAIPALLEFMADPLGPVDPVPAPVDPMSIPLEAVPAPLVPRPDPLEIVLDAGCMPDAAVAVESLAPLASGDFEQPWLDAASRSTAMEVDASAFGKVFADGIFGVVMVLLQGRNG